MSENIWNFFVVLVEMNILIIFLSLFMSIALFIKTKSHLNISNSSFLKLFNVLLILAIVFPFFKIEHAQNFFFEPLITRNTTTAPKPIFKQHLSSSFKTDSDSQNFTSKPFQKNSVQQQNITQSNLVIPIVERNWGPLQAGLGKKIGLVLVILSTFGLLAFCIRYLITLNKFRSLLINAYPIRKIGRVNVLVSDQISGPFSISIQRRKYIFVPNFMLDDKESFKLSIKHEIQHHRQWDTRFIYLIESMRSMLFYNPFAWHLTSQFNFLHELSCDEVLLNKKKVSVKQYSQCLIRLAENQITATNQKHIGLLGSASLCSSAKQLKMRIIAMRTTKYYSKITAFVLGITILSVFSGVGFAAKQTVASTSTSGPEFLNTSPQDELYMSDATYFPASGERAIVWVPGFIFKKESWFKMAKSLQAEGIASIAINGNSVNHVRSALQQLARRGHRDFILVGGSSGAKAVLNTVDRVFMSDFVSGVVTMSAVGGSPIDDFNRTVPLRKLFIVSEEEKHMKTVQKIYDESKMPKEINVVPGKAHAQFLFYGPNKAEVTNLIKDFILH